MRVSLAELDPEFPTKQDDEEVIAVKCSWFSSLKAKTSYDVSLVMEKSGNVLRRCDMSKPEVAEHVTPRFYMFSYPFLLLQKLGEANSLQDNKLL